MGEQDFVGAGLRPARAAGLEVLVIRGQVPAFHTTAVDAQYRSTTVHELPLPLTDEPDVDLAPFFRERQRGLPGQVRDDHVELSRPLWLQ